MISRPGLTLSTGRYREAARILGGVRRIGEEELAQVMAEHIGRTRPYLVGVEEGAYRQAATQDLIRRVQRNLHGKQAVAVLPVRVTHDKVFRAQLPAARGQAGQLYADRGAPWFPAFEAECLSFPLGRHDDMVDALAGAVQLALEKVDTQPQPARKRYYSINAAADPADDWDPFAEYNAQFRD